MPHFVLTALYIVLALLCAGLVIYALKWFLTSVLAVPPGIVNIILAIISIIMLIMIIIYFFGGPGPVLDRRL